MCYNSCSSICPNDSTRREYLLVVGVSTVIILGMMGVSAAFGFAIAHLSFPYKEYQCTPNPKQLTLLCFCEGFIISLVLVAAIILLGLSFYGICLAYTTCKERKQKHKYFVLHNN